MAKLKLYGTHRLASLRGTPPAAAEGEAVLGAGALPWTWRAASLFATLLAGALLALVAAHWGWRWFGPGDKAPAAAVAAASPIDPIIAAAPFGRAPPPVAAPGSSAAAAPRSGGLPADAKLLGVFAGKDGSGYALLRLPERGPLLVHSGQDISPGVRLEAVVATGIRINEQGQTREVLLRPEGPAGGAPAAGATGTSPVPASAGSDQASASRAAQRAALRRGDDPACLAPKGFTGPIYRLNAELLTGMAAQPQSWAALLAPDAGALVVRDETGLAAMLGMKAKDRLLQANGIPLNAVNDVLTAIVKPLTANQSVRLSGVRDGKPREWLFLNAGTCPG